MCYVYGEGNITLLKHDTSVQSSSFCSKGRGVVVTLTAKIVYA